MKINNPKAEDQSEGESEESAGGRWMGWGG